MKIMKLVAVLAGVFSLSIAANQQAAAHFLDPDCALTISTGFNYPTDSKLPNLTPDPNWIIGAGSTNFVGTHPLATDDTINPVNWLDDNVLYLARWLSVWDSVNKTFVVPVGTYYFETTFDMTGLDPLTAYLHKGRYAADNRLANIYLNGTNIWTNPGSATEEFAFFTDLPEMLGVGAFNGGINTLRFEVLNTGKDNTPVGFRFEGCIMAVPEPSSVVLAISGVALLGVTGWRRKRRAVRAG